MRKKRLSEILAIIREQEIENQETLLSELKKRGYEVTQATVSRDIRHLGLEKSYEGEVGRYVKKSAVSTVVSPDILKSANVRADYAVNTVVLKCTPGWAGAICSAVDRMGFTQIVGTIAGDDTVFVLTRSEDNARELYQKLLDLL